MVYGQQLKHYGLKPGCRRKLVRKSMDAAQNSQAWVSGIFKT